MSRSTQENEAILKQFRDWLAKTVEEADALDRTTPGDGAEERPKDEVVPPAMEIVSEDDEASVNFTACTSGPAAWTEEATQFDETVQLDPTADTSQPREEPTSADDSLPEQSVAQLPEVGLRQLVEAFTTMRHETKLQTKSTRGLVDAVQSSLAGLDAAMHQFQAAARSQEKETRENEAVRWSVEEAAMPFVEAIVELDEALLRGSQAFEATTQASPERLGEMLDELLQGLPWWHRWTTRAWHRRIRRRCLDTMEQISSEELAHLKEGYALIRGRFQRVLREHDVCRIESVGRRVDPEEMNVVELVNSQEVEPETVVEEVRPGYKWRDRVIRFAEVRAVGGSRKKAADGECHRDEAHCGSGVFEDSRLEGNTNSRPIGRVSG